MATHEEGKKIPWTRGKLLTAYCDGRISRDEFWAQLAVLNAESGELPLDYGQIGIGAATESPEYV